MKCHKTKAICEPAPHKEINHFTAECNNQQKLLGKTVIVYYQLRDWRPSEGMFQGMIPHNERLLYTSMLHSLLTDSVTMYQRKSINLLRPLKTLL